MPNIKNIIIFITIAAAFILIYIFFIKPAPVPENLTSSPSNIMLPNIDGSGADANTKNKTSLVAKDFLALLLNVKNIKLDDAIFSDIAFGSLHDSSIVLIPDGNEGRPNPFAQFGNDNVVTPVAPVAPATPVTPNTTNP
jgi:hypothetical protein